MEGDEVIVSTKLDDRGRDLREQGYEYAIAGRVRAAHDSEEEGGGRVIDAMDITEISIVHNRTKLRREPEEGKEG
jgi:hypothetical protein